MSRRLQRALSALEEFTVDVIYDRRRDRMARWWGGFLRGLSGLFGALVSLRFHLYQNRLLRAHHLGCQVIVVGNLTVGGTGKTPVVEKLARHLRDEGRRVAILSRGYKSKSEPAWQRWWRKLTHAAPAPPRIVSDGEQVLLGSDVAGDEPYMLARNLPGVIVITDKDRVKAGRYAIKHFGADLLILDDGFQYYRLKDHLQLLLIDQSNPFGNGHLLPRGILREPVQQLRRASYIFLTKSAGPPDPALVATIRQHRPGSEWIECTHQPQYLQALHGASHLPLRALAGKRVAALSAIAAPESFERFLEELGAHLVLRQRYLDHHRFSPDELAEFYAAAAEREAEWIVTTEKDAVRIPAEPAPRCPAWFLRVEIRIIRGADDFAAAVERIGFQLNAPAPRAPTRTGEGQRQNEGLK